MDIRPTVSGLEGEGWSGAESLGGRPAPASGHRGGSPRLATLMPDPAPAIAHVQGVNQLALAFSASLSLK